VNFHSIGIDDTAGEPASAAHERRSHHNFWCCCSSCGAPERVKGRADRGGEKAFGEGTAYVLAVGDIRSHDSAA